MSAPTHLGSSPSTHEAETLEATYDSAVEHVAAEEEAEETVSYLVPRLAAYAASSSASSAGVDSHSALPSDQENDDSDDGGAEPVDNATADGSATRQPATGVARDALADEERRRDGGLRSQRDSGERSAAHVTDDSVGDASHRFAGEANFLNNEEAEAEGSGADALHYARQQGLDAEAQQGVDEDDNDGNYGKEEEDEEVAWNVDEDNAGEDEEEGEDTHASHHSRQPHSSLASSTDFTGAFAHSRVKELLKFEGSSSIISKDAAAAASEAVALLTRDLVAMAAAEAARRGRKTVTYDDVARVAQMLDRFSYLSEVVPPVPAASSTRLGASKSIVVSSQTPIAKGSAATTATAAPGEKKGKKAARSRSAQKPGSGQPTTMAHPTIGAGSGVHSPHPQPGGMRQATLRF